MEVNKRKPMKHIVIDARIRRSSTGRPVEMLLDRLQRMDKKHRYTVVVEDDDDWMPTANNFSVFHSKYPIFSMNPFHQLTYAGQLNKLKADLVYFTLTPQQPALYMKPFITLTHDLGMLKYARAGKLPEWLHSIRMMGYRFLLRSAHRRAERVIVPTEFVADDVNKYHLDTNRKTVVMYEASGPAPSVTEKTPKKPPKEFIMYTGSAFPHKNLERLISAFKLLKEHHPKLKLILLGKREYYSGQLEVWAKEHKLDKDVVFAGYVPDGELKWYYNHAMAYVFPSLNEGFGLPGLEAMSHGCPVVSSNTSSLPEVHGNAAHYFDPEDVQDMVQRIDEVLSKKELRDTLIKKGYKNVQRFSWDTFAKQHISLFKELLDA